MLHDLIRALPPGATLEIQRVDAPAGEPRALLSLCVRLPDRAERVCGDLALSPEMALQRSFASVAIDRTAAALLEALCARCTS